MAGDGFYGPQRTFRDVWELLVAHYEALHPRPRGSFCGRLWCSFSVRIRKRNHGGNRHLRVEALLDECER